MWNPLSRFKKSSNQTKAGRRGEISRGRGSKDSVIPLRTPKPNGKVPISAKQRTVAEEIKRARRAETARLARERLYERFLFIRPFIFMTLLLIGIAILIGLVVFGLHRAEIFTIKDVEVSGNQQISTLDILSALPELKGSSLVQVNAGYLEVEILRQIPYIKDVVISKVLPSKLEIEVFERYPRMAYINRKGIFLVDEEYEVVEVLALTADSIFNESEAKILLGQQDLEDEYLIQYYIDHLTDITAADGLRQEDIPAEAKQQAWEAYRAELLNRQSGILNEKIELFALSRYGSLFNVRADDESEWKVGDRFTKIMYDYSTSMKSYLDSEKLLLDNINWTYPFQMVVTLQNGVKLIFSTERLLTDQLADLQVLRLQGKVDTARVVDLQGEVISIK